MTFRERLVTQLLLMVARILCEDLRLATEIKNIATHIAVHGKEAEAA